MRATVMYSAGDVRIETVPDARIIEPTDALVSVTRACICGSDLWPYKSMEPSDTGRRMGHEAIGVVEDGRGRRSHRQSRRSRRHAVRLLRRHLRLLPRGIAHVVRARRVLRHEQARRRSGRSGARAARRRHALRSCRRLRMTRSCRRSSLSRT